MSPSQSDRLRSVARCSAADEGRSIWPTAASLPPPPSAAISGRTPAQSHTSRLASALLALAAVFALVGFQTSGPDAQSEGQESGFRINAAPAHKEVADGRPVAWLKKSVTITMDPSLDSVGPGADAVRGAFGAWLSTSARIPSVSFDIATVPGLAARDGVNRVLLAPIDIPGHQKDLSISISYIDEATGEILEVDVILNSLYHFAVLDGDAHNVLTSGGPPGKCGKGIYDIQNVAAHEVGHFFGLGEDRDDPGATMYFESGSCETFKRDLEPVDADALIIQYERAAEAQQAQISCSYSGSTTATSPAISLALAMLTLLGRRGRRRH